MFQGGYSGHGDAAVYLPFNNIVDDKSAVGGNVLTGTVLAKLPNARAKAEAALAGD